MDITLEQIEEVIAEMLKGKPVMEKREYVIRTGAGGADMFYESVELQNGFERLYCGYHISRIMKKVGRFRKSLRGRYYRLVKINQWTSTSEKKEEKE